MMKMTQIKIAAAILVIAALTGTGTVVTIKRSVAQDHAASQPGAVAANNPSSVAGVQQEEIDTLNQMIEYANQKLQRGIGSAEDVYQLKHQLTEVKLRKAGAADERISILTSAVADAKSEEQSDAELYKAGVVDFLKTQDAKMYRLGLEERLLQAEGK